jgi:hypothetical protein
MQLLHDGSIHGYTVIVTENEYIKQEWYNIKTLKKSIRKREFRNITKML